MGGGTQQKVVSPVGVTVPVGWPSTGAQVPPTGAVVVAFMEKMSWSARGAQVPEVSVSAGEPVQLVSSLVADPYRVNVTVQVAPVGAPQLPAAQPRVSILPE